MTDRAVTWIRRNAGLLSLAGALLLQGGATIWWTAILSQRVTQVERVVADNQPKIEQIPAMKESDQKILMMLEKISSDVNRLNDRLWELSQRSMERAK